MPRLRNSVKALIRRQGAILLIRKQDFSDGEIYYLLPGGGQEGGETFTDALRREVREETGLEIRIGDLVLIREYIGRNHEYAQRHAEVHQIEFVFECEPLSVKTDLQGTHPDHGQIGIEWVDLTILPTINLYPKMLLTALDSEGNIHSPIYRGDVN